MAWNNFELIFDLSDGKTEIIKHSEYGLYLKVLPEERKKDRYATDEMVFVASFYGRSLSGKPLKDHVKTAHLQVMNLNSGKNVLWDAQLLTDAVKFYCVEHLDRRLDKLSVHFNGRLMPFEEDHSFIDD